MNKILKWSFILMLFLGFVGVIAGLYNFYIETKKEVDDMVDAGYKLNSLVAGSVGENTISYHPHGKQVKLNDSMYLKLIKRKP